MKIFQFTKRSVTYSHDLKESFHYAGLAALRKIAKALNLNKKDFDLRSNFGGIAVSGEITLHHENIYIQIYQSCVRSYGDDHTRIMFRRCEGRKDYTGKSNNFMNISELKNFDLAVAKIQKILVQT